VQSDVLAGIATWNGDQANVNPAVIVGFGGAGYTALRVALNDPLGVVGVITMDTPIEATTKSNTDPRPDLITMLARLNVPVQFHAGTADPDISREQLNWLGRFVAVQPDRRELFLYGSAGKDFYLPSSKHYDKGYHMLAQRRWREFLLKRFS
jgi:dienelactone hydrolase